MRRNFKPLRKQNAAANDAKNIRKKFIRFYCRLTCGIDFEIEKIVVNSRTRFLDYPNHRRRDYTGEKEDKTGKKISKLG